MSRLPKGVARLAEPRWALPLLALLALLLRLPRLGESLWLDEVLYSTHHGWGTWSQLFASFLTDPSAPLYRLLLFGWVELFGENELVVRLPSLLLGIGSLLLTCELVRRRSGDGAALLAGLFLALSPAHVWYSQEATAYALTLCLVVAAAGLGERLVEEPFSRLHAGLFAVALLAAVFSHFYVAALLPPFAWMALSAQERSRRWMLASVAFAGIAVAGMLIAKILAGHLATGQSFLRAFTPFEAWMLLFHWFLEGNALWTVSPYGAAPRFLLEHPLLLICQLFVLALLLRGLVASGDRSRGRVAVDAALLASLPLALGLLGLVGYRHLYVERYLLPVLPFYVALLARGAMTLRSAGRRGLVAAALVLLSALAWFGWWRQPERWTVYKPNPDWRGAVRLLLEETPAGSGALVIGGAPLDDLAFYVRRMDPSGRLVVLGARALPGPESEIWQGRRTVHLVRNRVWSGEFDRIRSLLDRNPNLRRAGGGTASNVEVITYERK